MLVIGRPNNVECQTYKTLTLRTILNPRMMQIALQCNYEDECDPGNDR